MLRVFISQPMIGKTDKEIEERLSIELLSTADLAYFAKGWETARGCIIGE
ncbi:MAG: Nucleoside 2-deoxyribosyltransferase like protein [Bacteriophage sp.]|nr:MAG: Nucleoside 2-deoxyribosyltransferase like protein [Bacteriophage sp.]